jgi:electron transfer flavoprotein alpha subunit
LKANLKRLLNAEVKLMAEIKILVDKCTGCTLCEKACPFDAIEMQNKKAVILDNCTLCGICVDSCKFDAIEFTRDEESPVENLNDFRGIWVFAEQKNRLPTNVSYELLGEGKKLAEQLNTDLSAVLLGNNLEESADLLIKHGADNVYMVDHPSLENFNDESYTDIFIQLISEYKPEIVLMGATTYGRSLAPRISSRLETGLTADCTSLEIDTKKRLLLQTRPAFGGNLMATIVCPSHRPQMATVRPKVMKALPLDPSRKGQIIKPEVKIPEELKTKVFEKVATIGESVSLEDADIIVAGGRGLGDAKHLHLIEELAEALGAAVAASRAVVDAGWIDYSRQVGQTGKTVGPKIYIACGISGAVQHMVGMSSSDTIIAINKNPDAPIFKFANIGIVGDVHEVIPALIKELKSRQG